MELNNFTKVLIVAGVVLVIVVLIWWGMRPPTSDLPPLDPFNYKSVALHFVHEDGRIVRKMGKIISASQIGDGGNVPKSHNVFRLQGENKGAPTSGMCYVTLQRVEDNKYVVIDAVLNMGGSEFKIPVKGLKGRKKGMQVF